MKKIYLLVYFLLLGTPFVFGQLMDDDDNNQLKKIYIAISPFTKSEHIPDHAVEKAYSAIMDIISMNKRFELMDRREMDKLQAERNMQQSEDFQNTFKLKNGESVGAAYYITGNVTEYKAFAYDKKGKLFQANYKVQVRLINVQTGKVIYSELISPRNAPVKPLKSKDEAKWKDNPLEFEAKKIKLFSYPNKERALEDIEKQLLEESQLFVDRLLSNAFPIYIKIHSVLKTNKKGIPSDLQILGGSNLLLKEREVLTMIEETEIKINDKESTKKYTEVGKVRIIKIEGESISVARIIRGNKVIGEKIAQNAKLKVKK